MEGKWHRQRRQLGARTPFRSSSPLGLERSTLGPLLDTREANLQLLWPPAFVTCVVTIEIEVRVWVGWTKNNQKIK